MTTTYSGSRKVKYGPQDYPRRCWNGKLDKGKKKASEAEDMIDGPAVVGGLHMMNYTGPRKKWSHDVA
jgi:hypothetical protein